ncbi:WD repeat-containing protein 44 [Bienertia sinuspersici]
MGSLSEEDEHYFDSKDYITPVSDSGSYGVEISDSESRCVEDVVRNFGYEVWIRSPGTIGERRQKLLKLMGITSNQGVEEMHDAESSCRFQEEVVDSARILENSGTVLRSSFKDSCSSSQSSISCCSNDTQDMLDIALEENLVRRIKNLDDGSEFIVDELGQDGLFRRLRERAMRRDVGLPHKDIVEGKKRTKKGWLRKLGVVACVADTQSGINRVDSLSLRRRRAHNVRVRTCRKRSKDFSGLYMGQDIVGHEGAILTMKFSPDGQLLASAGEDGIVRVWQVIEAEKSEIVHVPDVAGSNVYFTVNPSGELVPLNVDKEKKGKLKNFRKTSESACIIFPQKVFQLVEKPLHVFHGHRGEVLDLSWSNNNYLLSSSVDRTVRLWKVGFDDCLKVFHTVILFNPIDENYFISGSVDGKVRLWTISGCGVVDWTDIREIVTAVCYQPNGKGAVVGSISGDCYFFDTSVLDYGVETDICVKPSLYVSLILMQLELCKTFKALMDVCGSSTGYVLFWTKLLFSPGDSSKLMVTTADSQVRILKGVDVICLRNAGSQISASFTSDGKHIVSASEDSFVYAWDCTNSDRPISSHNRSKSSCERFFSNNACVAVPWHGTTSGNILPSLSGSSQNRSGIVVRYTTESGLEHRPSTDSSLLRTSLFSTDTISLGFSDPFTRGVATWPEEKLTNSNSLTVSSETCKSEYKFLKTTCQNMRGSTHTWV